MLDQIMEVLTPSALLVSIFGGFFLGMVCSLFVPTKTVLAMRWYLMHVVTMLTVLTVGFWVGQGINAYLDGDPLWWRAVIRFVLQIIFSVMVGFGIYAALRWRNRHSQQVEK